LLVSLVQTVRYLCSGSAVLAGYQTGQAEKVHQPPEKESAEAQPEERLHDRSA
jgi:hypothetical protein